MELAGRVARLPSGVLVMGPLKGRIVARIVCGTVILVLWCGVMKRRR